MSKKCLKTQNYTKKVLKNTKLCQKVLKNTKFSARKGIKKCLKYCSAEKAYKKMSALRAEKKLKNSLIFFRASRDFGTFKPKKCLKKH